MGMGRRRSKRLDLPPRMHAKAGGYYHVSSALRRKWTPLGKDLAKARIEWARLEGRQDSRLMSTAIDKYLAEEMGDLAGNTRKSYERLAIPIRKVFGEARFDQIKKHHVYDYRDKHKHKMSANLEIGFLKTVYRAMNKWGWTEDNPCVGVKRHKVRKRERYLEDAEFLAIRAKAPDYVRAAMDIAYCLASRRSDVSKIHLSDIKGDVLMVVQMKTGKKQPFTITPILAEAIERAKALPRPVRGLWLFCRRDGQPYKASSISGAFKAAAKRAGVADARFHDVRGKAATDAKRLGMDYQALLGHASIVTSESYVRARLEDRVMPLSRKL
jgi:integrase